MKTTPVASFTVTDPEGLYRQGEFLPRGAMFAGRRGGAHVERWLRTGRIRVVPAKQTTPLRAHA